ncbi:Fic family protein [bacterium]|nr:Fic family protein [bacterium]
MTRVLSEIDYIRGRIAAASEKGVFVPRLQKEAAIVMAYASTTIEGSTLTPQEVRMVAAGKTPPKPKVHVQMVKNYLSAVEWIRRKKSAKSIPEKDVLSLHRIIGEGAVDDGPVGAYRQVQVYVGNHVPPAGRSVPIFMRTFLQLLNRDWQEYHPVITSALAHLQMATIHPFRDGNGRTARALASWELYRRGHDSLHIFTVDDILLEKRSLYYSQLDNARTPDGLGDWIEYIADVTADGLERAEKRLQALAASEVTTSQLSETQQKLLRLLSFDGPASIARMTQALRISRQGLYKALTPLLESKSVQKTGTRRSRKYFV